MLLCLIKWIEGLRAIGRGPAYSLTFLFTLRWKRKFLQTCVDFESFLLNNLKIISFRIGRKHMEDWTYLYEGDTCLLLLADVKLLDLHKPYSPPRIGHDMQYAHKGTFNFELARECVT